MNNNNDVEELLRDALNTIVNDNSYWEKLNVTRKKQWIEHYKYGDLLILLNGAKDPFPQPPI